MRTKMQMPCRMTGLFSVLAIIILVASVPKILNYQGKLLDSEGIGINGTFPIIFKLYTTESSGSLLWSENQTVIITNGLFSVFLANVTPFPDSVNFSNQYWLEVQIETETLTPRERLTSAPYSIRSEYTTRAIQSVYSDSNTTRRTGSFVFRAGSGATLADDGSAINITLGNASLSQVLADGNNALGQQIKNLGEPTEDQDAATKQYADNISAAAGGVNSITGGAALSPNIASTGNVTLNVNVDNSTIEIGSDTLRIKTGGITSNEIFNGTITTLDIGDGQVSSVKIATGAVGPDQLASISTVTPGSYNNASITVDEDGRITVASNGAVSGMGGIGTANYISKFTASSTLGNSAIYESSGNVGIGTTSPDTKLHIVGSIKMVDGNQGSGKVLTSNASGVGSWGDFPVPNYPPPTVISIIPNTKALGYTSFTAYIRGTGFQSVSQAKIGDTGLTNVNIIRPDSIIATVPTGIIVGTYDVKVSNLELDWGIGTGLFTVTGPPPWTESVCEAAPYYGYWSNDYLGSQGCWFTGNFTTGQSCNVICAAVGLSCYLASWDDPSCVACRHYHTVGTVCATYAPNQDDIPMYNQDSGNHQCYTRSGSVRNPTNLCAQPNSGTAETRLCICVP